MPGYRERSDRLTGTQVRLKHLLRERHWQTYQTFCDEYDKAARSVEVKLVGTWPSRAQLHRWTSGELRGMPYPHHCRVLEAMLPGWRAEQLFKPCPSDEQDQVPTGQAMGNQSATDSARLMEAIARGLKAPDSYRPEWSDPAVNGQRSGGRHGGSTEGIALPTSVPHVSGVDPLTSKLGRRLIELKSILRLSERDALRLALLSGNVVDLDLRIDLDIKKDGHATVTYRYRVLNLSDQPITRLPRELWFEEAKGPLRIAAIHDGEHRIAIQRIHDTSNLVRFACQVSPPIQPGEVADIAYACSGGRFVASLYWRQSVARYTRHLTIRLRHREAGELIGCTALEESPDGSAVSAGEGLVWDYEGEDVLITLARDYLRPNQHITMRWRSRREPGGGG